MFLIILQADTEPIYWSWVRAIAAELVRQTPFRAQRCLNFLEILTICPRGPIPLPDSPPDLRKRSRSELRCWLGESPLGKSIHTATILDDLPRRARSELRYWSSSNSSDEDIVGTFRSVEIPQILPKIQTITRTWGCSESSEGSDDSLPWGGNTTSQSATITLPDAPTREQRIQRYKEARRRENEMRTKRVLEEDARKRKARAEENNNELNRYTTTKLRTKLTREINDQRIIKTPIKTIDVTDSISIRLPPIKPVQVKFHDHKNLEDTRNNNNNNNTRTESSTTNFSIIRTDSGERRSRARERRNLRDTKTLQDYKDRLSLPALSKIPVSKQTNHTSSSPRPPETPTRKTVSRIATSPASLSFTIGSTCEEDVAKLLERCQRVDHYVPVKEKLTLFESLSRLGGRLARSTEDLGRTLSTPAPRGKQRARSLHDLNRGAKTVPVREMCRLFECEQDVTFNRNKEQQVTKNLNPPCVRASTRRKHYQK